MNIISFNILNTLYLYCFPPLKKTKFNIFLKTIKSGAGCSATNRKPRLSKAHLVKDGAVCSASNWKLGASV